MKNAMTIAGYIRWSEDGSQVWYKEETLFQMDEFKAFVHLEVGRIRVQLGNEPYQKTHLRRLGQRLGLIVRKWGLGILLILGQNLSDFR